MPSNACSRDAKITQIYDGSNQIMRQIVADQINSAGGQPMGILSDYKVVELSGSFQDRWQDRCLLITVKRSHQSGKPQAIFCATQTFMH